MAEAKTPKTRFRVKCPLINCLSRAKALIVVIGHILLRQDQAREQCQGKQIAQARGSGVFTMLKNFHVTVSMGILCRLWSSI